MPKYDPIQDMKRQDQERDRLSYALMEQERAERKRLDAASWAEIQRMKNEASIRFIGRDRKEYDTPEELMRADLKHEARIEYRIRHWRTGRPLIKQKNYIIPEKKYSLPEKPKQL